MANGKGMCKYCGCSGVGSTSNICSNCYAKLRLIRTLLKMVRDTFEMYGKGRK